MVHALISHCSIFRSACLGDMGTQLVLVRPHPFARVDTHLGEPRESVWLLFSQRKVLPCNSMLPPFPSMATRRSTQRVTRRNIILNIARPCTSDSVCRVLYTAEDFCRCTCSSTLSPTNSHESISTHFNADLVDCDGLLGPRFDLGQDVLAMAGVASTWHPKVNNRVPPA